MQFSKTFAALVTLVCCMLPSWVKADLVCDTNGDDFVDINDVRSIVSNRNQLATGPDDPMDLDRNGIINLLDARGCVLTCSLPRCAEAPVVTANCILGSSKIGECKI